MYLDHKAADVIVKEDIRQKEIFLNNKDKYLPYVTAFASRCLNTFLQENHYVEDCVISILGELNIDHINLDKKVDTFADKCKGDVFESLLLDRNRFSQIGTYPEVILNRQPVFIFLFRSSTRTKEICRFNFAEN